MNFNPDSWMDVVAYLIVGVPSMVAAFGSLKIHDTLKKANSSQAVTADAVLDEVRNDHTTNLRDDIDGIRSLIHDGMQSLHKDVRELRAELRTERIERIEGDKRH